MHSTGLIPEIGGNDFTFLDVSAGCDEPFLKFDLEYNEMLVLETAAARRATSQVSRPHAGPFCLPPFSLSPFFFLLFYFWTMFRTFLLQLWRAFRDFRPELVWKRP